MTSTKEVQMSDKKYIIRNISNNQIDFDNLFDERNIYNMTKEEFFSPSVDDEHDAMSMHDMPKSIDKILSVMNENKKICIYGDYDVDGTSATAILLKTFDIMGYKNVTYYIPADKTTNANITLKPTEKFQTVYGFGSAITGSTCYNLMQMSPADRKNFP